MLVMGVTFFLVIFIMYLVIFFSVSKAIAPVEKLIQTTSIINDTNLGIRLSLPKHEDELHQLALTINELLDRLDRSILGQKQFTSDASHEIRTPLASIRGTLEILIRKKREPEEYESKIAEVISQTDRLTALLDQLLQLARLESVSIQGKKLLLNSIVEDSISKFSNHFRSKNIHYDFAVLGQFYVHGDSILLGIIIDNLIGNAIKYGKQGGELTIIIEERTRTLHVSNSGETMNTEQLSLLFNRFYRVDHSRSSGIPGSGLGLAIVKKLADLHDIEISVSSHDGINTFSLTFPEIL
jgi:signal transduction histidine kinase